MACFWKNERNAVEVCLREVGNYVYIGYEDPDPDYSLIEVARDLSGYVKTEIPGAVSGANGLLYSKRRRIYQPRYNTTPNPATVTIWRDDGAGVFSQISGVPTGLAPWSRGMNYTGGKLRGVNWDAGFNCSLYESDDGETWTVLPGSVTFNYNPTEPASYTMIGSRIVANRLTSSTGTPRFYYSDNGGATWVGAGGNGSGGDPQHPFLHSGANVIASLAGDVFVTSDGASWALNTSIYMWFRSGAPKLAANGSGRVVIYGQHYVTGDYAFAYSSNNGTSFTVRTVVAIGMPDFSVCHALFWDPVGDQFVAFIQRGDLSSSDPYQIYTSPTGQNWAAGIVIPRVYDSNVVQVID